VLGAASISVAASSGGCTRRATQLVVVVDSDLPAESVRCVRVETGPVVPDVPVVATREDVFYVAEGGGDGRVALPFSFGVVPPSGDARARVELRATAYDDCAAAEAGGAPGRVTTRTVRSGFLPEQALRVEVFLAARCARSPVCDADADGVEDEGFTCDPETGACVEVPDVVGTPIDPGGELLVDAGAADASGPDAGPAPRFSTLAWVVKEQRAPTTGDGLGVAVAADADGSFWVAGAPTDDTESSGGTVEVGTVTHASTIPDAVITTYVTGGGTLRDGAGAAVAVSADGLRMAIGIPGEDSSTTGVGSMADEAALESGAVATFRFEGGGWGWGLAYDYVKAPDTRAGDAFGTAVALDGTASLLAVGAPRAGAASGGAAYVYTRRGYGWDVGPILAPTLSPGDDFGAALAISADGSTLVIGAPGDDASQAGVRSPMDALDDALGDSGAAYVFRRSGAAWSLVTILKAATPGAMDRFGSSVAISADGSVVAVGAPGEDSLATGIDGAPNESDTDNGAVYVFRGAGVVWDLEAFVKPHHGAGPWGFGTAVALSARGDLLAVGAPGESTGAPGIDPVPDTMAGNSGAVFTYERVGSAWSPWLFVKAPNPSGADYFGTSVALAGDGSALFVGAPGEDSSGVGVQAAARSDSPGSTDSGAVYVYR
jgi:hypothetical protein